MSDIENYLQGGSSVPVPASPVPPPTARPHIITIVASVGAMVAIVGGAFQNNFPPGLKVLGIICLVVLSLACIVYMFSTAAAWRAERKLRIASRRAEAERLASEELFIKRSLKASEDAIEVFQQTFTSGGNSVADSLQGIGNDRDKHPNQVRIFMWRDVAQARVAFVHQLPPLEKHSFESAFLTTRLINASLQSLVYELQAILRELGPMAGEDYWAKGLVHRFNDYLMKHNMRAEKMKDEGVHAALRLTPLRSEDRLHFPSPPQATPQPSKQEAPKP